jgi:hypothetical protein
LSFPKNHAKNKPENRGETGEAEPPEATKNRRSKANLSAAVL